MADLIDADFWPPPRSPPIRISENDPWLLVILMGNTVWLCDWSLACLVHGTPCKPPGSFPYQITIQASTGKPLDISIHLRTKCREGSLVSHQRQGLDLKGSVADPPSVPGFLSAAPGTCAELFGVREARFAIRTIGCQRANTLYSRQLGLSASSRAVTETATSDQHPAGHIALQPSQLTDCPSPKPPSKRCATH